LPAIQGIELSRRFYAEVVSPWLAHEFPGLRHAAALIGYGSELLGFDDEMSRDHDFGPRAHLFVADSDFDAVGHEIVGRFAEIAPASFLGVVSQPGHGRHRADACGDDRHGLEVWTTRKALSYWLGLDIDAPLDGVRWLGLAEQRLLAVTAGAVFRDDIGELTALRERLSYLPRDVWLYKLACQWRRIAEEQAFVGRAGFAGDDLGSRVIAARLARDAMRMGFLIERRYAPYPKWFGTAFAQLPCASRIAPILRRALDAADWKTREAALAEGYLALAELHLARGLPGGFAPRIGPYFDRPFTVINADDIAAAIRSEIKDPLLAGLPIIGALDQVTDATPMIEAPAHAQAAMRALFDDVEAGALEET
jgi:hypothetical protein